MQRKYPTDEELLTLAAAAREDSYSPYSGFAVGAALLTESGKIYLGANIENAAFTPTVCAERVAFFKAINAGERKFLEIAVVGGAKDCPAAPVSPCGVCRQIMAEFCDKDFRIITLGEDGCTTLGELLPRSFGKDDLK